MTGGGKTTTTIVKSGEKASAEVILAERNRLLNAAQNTRLKEVIDTLYRAGDEVFGGTGGALRYETKTGKLLSQSGHKIKSQDKINEIKNITKQESLSASDRQLSQELIDDLEAALKEAGK